MSDLNFRSCTPSQAKQILAVVFGMPANKRPTVMIWGEPGSGKSEVLAQASMLAYGKPPVDVRLTTHESVDIKGLPTVDLENGATRWLKPDFLPREGRGCLFFDELTSARRDVMAAFYSIALDRKVDDLHIPEGWSIVAAGNDTSDGAIANNIGTALADRMIHLKVVPTMDGFVSYWEDKPDMHPAVLALLRQRPDMLSQNEERIRADRTASPTPRTWARAAAVLQAFLPPGNAKPTKEENDVLNVVLEGTLGREAAGQLLMTVENMFECAEPLELLKTDLGKMDGMLPKTMRSGISLAFALGYVCDDAAKITKGCAIMKLVGDLGQKGKLAATEGAKAMNGREVAALGMERLLRKAEALKITDKVLYGKNEGTEALMEYLDVIADRYAEVLRASQAGA